MRRDRSKLVVLPRLQRFADAVIRQREQLPAGYSVRGQAGPNSELLTQIDWHPLERLRWVKNDWRPHAAQSA